MNQRIIHVGKNFIIKLVDESLSLAFISKTVNQSLLPAILQTKFENEASFAHENISGFRKVHGIDSANPELSLKLEYIEGNTLDSFFPILKKDIDKLKLSINITRNLARIHAQQIIHLNLSPEHIIIEEKSNEIFFISLGIATHIQRKIVVQNKLLFAEADPDFIAPEQTGRINAEIGYSSDIYALGIIFYKLFTGRMPFELNDRAAKIHAQIALTPEPPKLVSNVHPVISDLILKMVLKDIKQRYHSAEGVIHDLDIILKSIETTGDISEFELGKNDSIGIPIFTNQLYGRKKEITIIKELFDKISDGSKELLLVYGLSGVGKSSLVDYLYRPAQESDGFFVFGKFDSLKSDVPYFAFSQALGKLVDYVLMLEEDVLNQWKNEFYRVLHPIGRVLYDIIPGLEKLLENEPELPLLQGFEAQLRFNYAISKFLKVFSDENKPLVLFLDDLQWSDEPSLQLVKNIFNNIELRKILIIGAYRDNEITTGHKFLQFKLDVEEMKIPTNEVHLENLLYEDVHNFVHDTLGFSTTSLDGLISIIHKKSSGNALFLNQFLKSIYSNEMLYFDRAKSCWIWDEEKLLGFNVEGDIVNLLLQTINKLQQETISLLKIASCIGNKFQLDILVKITEDQVDKVYKDLKPAINTGLIIEAQGKNMYFVHDRIQQAIYSLTDDKDKKKFHLEIGKLLLNNTPEHLVRESIFDIVNQFNFAKELIVDKQELIKLSELNFMAGFRSQNATAYFVALQYFENAIKALQPDFWSMDYANSFNLYFQSAVAANQCNARVKFNEYVEILDSHVKDRFDKIRIANLKIQSAIAENNHKKVIEIGLSALNYLNVRIKPKPSQIDVLIGYILTNRRLSKITDSEISKLPVNTDEDLIMTMSIMHHVSLAAYFIEPNMVPLIMFKLIQMTLKHGLSPKSPFAFVVFGYINIAYMNKIRQGIKMGILGNELSNKLKIEDQICSLKQVYNTFISHWLGHLAEAVPDLEEGLKKGLETGDFEFTSITGQLLIYWLFYSGEPLEKVVKRGELLSIQVAPLNQIMQIERIKLFRQSAINLILGVEDFRILKGVAFDEGVVEFEKKPAFDLYYYNLYAQKKFLALVFNQYEIAWEYTCEEKKYMIPIKGSPTENLFYFYESICISLIFANKSALEQKQLIKTSRKNLKRYVELVKISEINYKHRHELMLAEYYRLTGQPDKAMTAYSNSIKYARLNKYIQDEALAWERAGNLYQHLAQKEVAQFYLSNAYKAYAKWGAKAKLEQMNSQYFGFISMDEIGYRNSNIDLNTILKTIHLLSGEVVIENLLRGIMNLVAENAGAENAYLVFIEAGKKLIKASVNKSKDKVDVLQNIAYEGFEFISHAVVNYVAHNGELLVLDDAPNIIPYSNDPYILGNEIRSIVCIPLKHRGASFAFLYLENKNVNGAFTKERIEILQVISTQTAISLQNAMLFEKTSQLNKELSREVDRRKLVEDDLRMNEKRLELYNANLEQKVNERTQDLQSEMEKSDNLLLNILPFDIAKELKENGSAEPKMYDSVSVLFTDFKEFTSIAEHMNPAELVSEIDYCFKAFDHIVHKYNIEKIKTIGDSYMAVGGLPVITSTHAIDTVKAALEMRNFIIEHNAKRKLEQKPVFEMRLGIHTGNVVAGIVGFKKFAYDIWGDTVNLASRMESSGQEGKVNVSGVTYELVKDHFDCRYRGKVNAKSKKEIDMYFVESIKVNPGNS
ncbi:MAG: adenylate/guanylate cyclase domain-containing protein [Saprospiraceae bacterium]